jgi:hypothetical protein
MESDENDYDIDESVASNEEAENEILDDYFSSGLELQLGDIIQIISPTNLELNENTYYIYYIDEEKIKLVNLSNKQLEQLNVDKETKSFTDESITEIYLLSRSEEPGYAKQNGLTTGQWIDIHFGGEIPIIVTGVISNTEEDSIEITSFPENNVFYIDFEYKGISEKLPIDQIIKRDEPRGYINAPTNDIQEIPEADESSPSMEFTERGEIVINITPENSILEENVRDVLHGMYLDANELFAETKDVYQAVEIPESERKYGLHMQISDMVDQLLSDIPNYKRTPNVLLNIQKFINRYKELREKFSIFDNNLNVIDKKKYGSFYKPLAETLFNLDKRVKWIMPVVKQNKKFYYDENDEKQNISSYSQEDGDEESNFAESSDIIPLEMTAELLNLQQRIMTHNEDLNSTPFEPPTEKKGLLTFKRAFFTDIETIVSNYEDEMSHGCCTGKKHNNISSVKYAIQRYNYPTNHRDPSLPKEINSKMVRTGAIFDMLKSPPTEKMSIKSFIVFPQSVIQHSRCHLPKTSIMMRSNINQLPFYLFRFFKTLKQNQIVEHKINDLEKNKSSQKNHFEDIYSSSKVHILSLEEESLIGKNRENELYDLFLNNVLPSNEIILQQVENQIKYKLSFYDFIKELEPFMMYDDNIIYKIFNRISFRIRKQIAEFKKNFYQKNKEFMLWRNAKFHFQEHMSHDITNLLKENDAIYEYYKKYISTISPIENEKHTSTEILSKIVEHDNAVLFYKLTSMLLISLMTPDKLMDIFDAPELEDMSKGEKIASKDCIRRFLTKKYNSVEELQKDNNTEDVFYDEEYDDTPYSIIDKYKEERRKMPPDMFSEFLKENLLEKHDCPPNMVNEMVETLMNKTKRVRTGEYAVLKLIPSLSKNFDLNKMTEDEKEQIEIEKKIKTKIQYYRRVNNNWVKDNDIEENAFLDTNTFFCNVANSCQKNKNIKTCDALETSRKLIKKNEMQEMQENMKRDASQKLALSIEDIHKTLESQIEYYYKLQKRNRTLKTSIIYHQNNFTYEIGKYANTEEILTSPYANLFNVIRSQENFSKKQHDIVRFYSSFCREPLPEIESKEWLYCIETNIKLLPRSILLLANEFVSGGDYYSKLSEICKIYGKTSDDGDSVVDKYSGYELCKKEFVSEDFVFQGDEEEYPKDLGELISEAFTETKGVTKKQKLAKIYEDETSQHIYNVMSSLCFNMSIDDENIHELIMRLSCELVKTTIMSEKKYNDRLAKDEKKGPKKPLPIYEMYKNQTMITLVCSVLLVAVQTVIPGVKVRKTFPNCVKSFEGFPLLSGEEDIRGIKYIACVVGKTKSSIVPWNSVEKISVSSMEKGILSMLKNQVLLNNEVQSLYQKRKDVQPSSEDESLIPEEHSIKKWISFLPPLVKINIAEKLNGLSKDYHSETVQLLQDGAKEQHLHIQQYHVKNRLNTFAIVETINEIVKTKEVLLRTMSKVPFLENGCCSETPGGRNTHPLNYFIKEDDHIKLLLLRSMKNVEVVHGIEKITKPLLFYNNENTKWKCPDIPKEYLANDVYMAFIHYCNLDSDRPIPSELRVVIQEKPPGYNSNWSLEEKIAFLKNRGRQFGMDELNQMMQIIQRNNGLKSDMNKIAHPANVVFKEYLEYLENSSSQIITEPLCRFLLNVLDKNEDASRNLRNYLTRSKTTYYNGIIDFLKRYGKTVSQLELIRHENFIFNITEWNSLDRDDKNTQNKKTTIVNFIKNSIYFMTQDYPNIILNNCTFSSIPTHKWGLSNKHISNIQKIIINEKNELNKFKVDPMIRLFLENIQNWSADLKTFAKLIPLENEDIFDEETIYLLFSNLWYSVLYQFVHSANDPDLLEIDIQHNKNMKRQQKRESENENGLFSESSVPDENGTSLNDDDSQMNDYMLEDSTIEAMEFIQGNVVNLKESVCSLLITFLNLGQQNKKLIDKRYEEISKSVGMTKLQEKKAITDFLQNMEDDERKVEYMLKQNKMGRWNLGTQRGVFEYDKKQYDLEENANMARLYSEIHGEQNPTTDHVNTVVYEAMDVQQYESAQIQLPEEGYTDFNELHEEYYDNVGGDEEPEYF